MAAERIEIRTRERWHDMRRRDVTASVAGALFDVLPFCTPFQLWAYKSGKVDEDPEETPAMKRGRLLESVCLALYRETRPDVKIEWNGEPGGLGNVYLRDAQLRIGATVDAFAVDSRGPGVVQFKSVESWRFKRMWINEEGDPEPPLYVVLQAIVEAKLAGAVWAQVGALTVHHGIDLHVIDIPLHDRIFAELCSRVAQFWRRVETRTPMAPDFAEDGATIVRLYSEKPGTKLVDLRTDNRIYELLSAREKLMTESKVTEIALEKIKNELKFKIGDTGGAIVNGYTIKRHWVAERVQTVSAHARMTVSKKKEE